MNAASISTLTHGDGMAFAQILSYLVPFEIFHTVCLVSHSFYQQTFTCLDHVELQIDEFKSKNESILCHPLLLSRLKRCKFNSNNNNACKLMIPLMEQIQVLELHANYFVQPLVFPNSLQWLVISYANKETVHALEKSLLGKQSQVRFLLQDVNVFACKTKWEENEMEQKLNMIRAVMDVKFVTNAKGAKYLAHRIENLVLRVNNSDSEEFVQQCSSLKSAQLLVEPDSTVLLTSPVLERLHINCKKEISDEFFNTIPKSITSLSIGSKSNVTMRFPDIRPLNRLKEFIFNSNIVLKEVPGWVEEAPNLKSLHFACPVPAVPLSLYRLSCGATEILYPESIVELHLENTTLVPSLGAFTSLKRVTLKNIPQNYPFVPWLQVVTLCQVKNVPLQLFQVSHLKELYFLQCTELATLPDMFHQVPHLSILSISYTAIKFLPPSFTKLSQLHTLMATHTKLQALPNMSHMYALCNISLLPCPHFVPPEKTSKLLRSILHYLCTELQLEGQFEGQICCIIQTAPSKYHLLGTAHQHSDHSRSTITFSMTASALQPTLQITSCTV